VAVPPVGGVPVGIVITEVPVLQLICVELEELHAMGDGTPGFNVGDEMADTPVKEYVPAGYADGPKPPDAS
jgi:hypothetical protein